MEKIKNLILAISVFLLLFLGFFHKIDAINQDLGRHLINGQIILQTHQIPKINFFSYTYPDFPFINTHWLSEAVFYLLFNFFGFSGLLLISTIIVIIAFSAIYFFKQNGQKNNLTALTISSLLYLPVLFERTDIRPEIFSFLFLSIFIIILYKYREKFTPWVFLLPLIELLWVNMHIYFLVGIAVLSFFTIDIMIKNRNNLYCRYIGILILIFISSALITLINPNGLNGALYPFKVFQNYGYAIEENQNILFLWTYFQKRTIPFFVISATTLFLTLFLNIKKTKFVDWALASFFTILGIIAIRNFPLFVFATFIPFSKNFSSLFSKSQIFNSKHYSKTIVIVIFAFIFWQISYTYSTKKAGFDLETGAKNAADFFITNNIKGPIFNNFDIGSYLDYRFYQREKVFIDGRPEAYPSSFFQQVYIPMQENRNVFDKVSKQYNFHSIFFSHTDQTPWAETFIKNIIQDPNWKIIYLDDYVFISLKNIPSNKDIIEKFAMKPNFLPSNFQTADIDGLLRLAAFFQKTGLKNQEKQVYQRILNINPESCNVLFNLSIILSSENNPASSIYSNKFQQICR